MSFLFYGMAEMHKERRIVNRIYLSEVFVYLHEQKSETRSGEKWFLELWMETGALTGTTNSNADNKRYSVRFNVHKM